MNPLKAVGVVLAALVVQVCLLSRFSFEGARPDVMLLVAVAAGFVLGAERGAQVGFGAGLAFDLQLHTPLGLSAFVFTLVAYAVGSTAGAFVRASWWIAPLVVAVGSAGGVLAYAVVGQVLGQATLDGAPLTAIVVVVAGVNAVLAPLVVRALQWTRIDERGRHQSFFPR